MSVPTIENRGGWKTRKGDRESEWIKFEKGRKHDQRALETGRVETGRVEGASDAVDLWFSWGLERWEVPESVFDPYESPCPSKVRKGSAPSRDPSLDARLSQARSRGWRRLGSLGSTWDSDLDVGIHQVTVRSWTTRGCLECL